MRMPPIGRDICILVPKLMVVFAARSASPEVGVESKMLPAILK